MREILKAAEAQSVASARRKENLKEKKWLICVVKKPQGGLALPRVSAGASRNLKRLRWAFKN